MLIFTNFHLSVICFLVFKYFFVFTEKWGQELLLQNDILLKIAARKSDETARIRKLQNTDMYGTEGTFRKINLD